MDRRIVTVAVLVCAIAAADAGLAGSARDPRQQPNARDTAFAKQAVIRSSNLTAKWRPRTPTPWGGHCPTFNPDLSSFTVTGQARSAFRTSKGADMESSVRLFRTRAEATSYHRAISGRAVLRCLREGVIGDLRTVGLAPRMLWSRMTSSPGLGEHTAIYSVMYTVRARNGARVRFPVDVLSFQVGRSTGAVSFSYVPCADVKVALARLVVYRLARSARSAQALAPRSAFAVSCT
jgi:hypothetical protein